MWNVWLYIGVWLLGGIQLVVAQAENNFTQQGKASYYADKFNGKLTASGEIFTNDALTAAHPSLAFNTLVRVTNINNGKSVVVRINDRGPHIKARILDMSEAAAVEIGMLEKGIATVHVEVIGIKEQIQREKYFIAALVQPSFKDTAPTPDKKIAIPFSSGHTYTIGGIEHFPQGFAVQVAAYADLHTAKVVCNQLLKAEMHEVYIQVDWSKGEKAHRVLAGSFSEETQARVYKQKLDKLGFSGYIKKHF